MNINFKVDSWWFLSLPAFIYVIVRAWLLDFTYDECWTFLGYAQAPVWDIVVNTNPAANNHILHSLLMKWSAWLFGTSPFALRIPVLLSFLIYLTAVHQLVKELAPIWKTALIIGLTYNPYLLDYFVAARGYAPALAALLWAVVFIHSFSRTGSAKALWLGGIATIVMAWSNFTYLLPFMTWWLLALYVAIQRFSLRVFVPPLLTCALLSLVLFPTPILQLIKADELYYGASSLWETAVSIGARFFYVESDLHVFGALLVGLFTVSLGASVYFFIKRSSALSLSAISGVLVVGSILLNTAQHLILDAPFLVDRTGIFLIPLMLMSLPFIVSFLKERASRYLAFVLTFFLTVNFLQAVNFTHLLDFKEYADTESALRLIGEYVPADDEALEIGKSTYMNAPINYYKDQLRLNHIEQSGLAYCDEKPIYRVYYLFSKDLECVADKPVERIAYYPVSDTYVFIAKEEGLTKSEASLQPN